MQRYNMCAPAAGPAWADDNTQCAAAGGRLGARTLAVVSPACMCVGRNFSSFFWVRARFTVLGGHCRAPGVPGVSMIVVTKVASRESTTGVLFVQNLHTNPPFYDLNPVIFQVEKKAKKKVQGAPLRSRIPIDARCRLLA